MTPTELQQKLANRSKRWLDELDTYAAALVRLAPKDLVQQAIDTVSPRTENPV